MEEVTKDLSLGEWELYEGKEKNYAVIYINGTYTSYSNFILL